jgi:hypothetical protein
MVQCDKEMFKALGEEVSQDILNKRLCPDMNTIKDILRVKNSYTDKDERVSFSMQAVACDSDTEECADPTAIEQFFEDIYFTIYILKENIAFGDNSNIGQRPISVNDQFHSQFILNANQYRDNNNYIQFNKVTTFDDKFLLLASKSFLKLKKIILKGSSMRYLTKEILKIKIKMRNPMM